MFKLSRTYIGTQTCDNVYASSSGSTPSLPSDLDLQYSIVAAVYGIHNSFASQVQKVSILPALSMPAQVWLNNWIGLCRAGARLPDSSKAGRENRLLQFQSMIFAGYIVYRQF